jgi:hypothetical protein
MGGLVGLFYPWGLILQAVSIVHFIRRRPNTYWLLIILIGGGLGSLVYIVAEVVPDVNLLGGVLTRFQHRRRIKVLETVILENPAIGNQEELADLCLEDGQFARARQLYDVVIRAQADSFDAVYRRGLAALAMGDAAAALADLERVVAKEPKYDFYRAIGQLAEAHSLAGEPERADALFQQAVALSTLSETYYHYAAFLAARHRTPEARDWAQRILAKGPTMPRYLRRRERPWFRKAQALLKRLPAG